MVRRTPKVTMHSLTTTVFLLSAILAANGFLLNRFSNNVKFTLYRRGAKESKVNNYWFSGLDSFDPQAMTYFVIHGWNGDDGPWIDEMKDALLKREDANVILVEWGRWATNPNYFKAKDKCDEAGLELATFIAKLEKEKKASRTKMHLIGHSLGGQVAGFAGSKLQKPTKIARITGLDTSGIGFGCLFSNKNCLDPSDATFVDEIHSLVSALPKGHADFYPMPAKPLKTAIKTKILDAHFLAIDYFTKSIQAGNCSFKSTRCTTQLHYMDGDCSKNPVNSLGFFAKKPNTKPPNAYFLNINIDKPC